MIKTTYNLLKKNTIRSFFTIKFTKLITSFNRDKIIKTTYNLIRIGYYSIRFMMSVIFVKKICFKMNVTLHFEYNLNFFSEFYPQ